MHFNELISLVIFCFTVIISFVMWVIKRYRKNKIFTHLTPIKVFTIGFAVSLFAYIFLSSISNNIISLIDTGFVTIRNVKKYFKLDLAPSEFNAVISNHTTVSPAGRYYLTLLDLIIPLITIKLLFTAFRDYLTQWIYIFCKWRKFHIFSDLNEKSICLAEDIFDNSRKSTVIFTNVADKYSDGLSDRAKRINAHFTKKKLADFSYFKRQNTIYIMSDDDSANISSAIEISGLLNRRKADGEVYVLSSLATSAEHIDAINANGDNKHCVVHLINSAQIISYNLLFDYPLYKAADLAKSNKISVMVVGAGYIGMEFVKASMWAGVMNRYDYEITVVDKADREEIFKLTVADLDTLSKEIGLNLNYRFESADVNSVRFREIIEEHSDANYIVITLGNDEMTVNTSVTIRRELARAAVKNGTYSEESKAMIIPVISNRNYSLLLSQLDKEYGFTVYGFYEQVFRYSNIGYSKLDRIATYINWSYDKNYNENVSLEESEAQYKKMTEINKQSSRAAAVRTIYNLKEAGIDCLFEDGSIENEMTPDEAEARLRSADLQELEHKRWSAFMIMSGWDSWKLYSDDNYLSIEKYNKNKHKLPIAKLHGCLVNNNKLDEISTVVPATGEGDALRNNDRVVVNASAKALKSVYDNVRFINNPQER